MGWLEVLALLKNTLPHLLDLKPLLQRVLARGNENEHLQRMLAELSTTLREDAKASIEARDTLDAYGQRLLLIEHQLRQLKSETEAANAGAEQAARDGAELAKLVRAAFVVTTVLLLVCIGLMVLLLRHQL